MSLALPERDRSSMDGTIHACPLREHSTSFQLVDEFGDGQPYAGLAYQIIDHEDIIYTGKLDATGSGKVENHYCGPVELRLNQTYQGREDDYNELIVRKNYPLPITELQVRAEKTRFSNKSGLRTQSNPAQDKTNAGAFYQVEVRELVEHGAHLPPLAARHSPPNFHVFKLFRPLPVKGSAGYKPELTKRFGVALMPNRHTVLEVRPLRALRPMLSPSNDFCALNLYQLALMSTLSYSDFAQQPNDHPVETDTVSFPLQPSIGNWFADALAKFDELWQVDAAQAGGKAYYPLYEEVPYSRRLEVVPFDPELYPQVNSPSLGEKQENPATIHWLDDRAEDGGTDTQAFITHHDALILLSIRGTASVADALRDMDATQVPFGDSPGKVHNGFYGAAKVAYLFVTRYLNKFYSGQKLVITGHSLGGAIALIVSEMLRRRPDFTYDIVLYTYGAPRAADAGFIKAAGSLVHHRVVDHNDPVPSMPGSWMDVRASEFGLGVAPAFVNVPAGLALFVAGMTRLTGEPYQHHGTLHYLMPVESGPREQSHILWEPVCETVTQHALCRLAIEQPGQLLEAAGHSPQVRYISGCREVLRRYREAFEASSSRVTEREVMCVDLAFEQICQQLRTRYREAVTRPGKPVAQTINQLMRELAKVQRTREHLYCLRSKKLSEVDVYGA